MPYVSYAYTTLDQVRRRLALNVRFYRHTLEAAKRHRDLRVGEAMTPEFRERHGRDEQGAVMREMDRLVAHCRRDLYSAQQTARFALLGTIYTNPDGRS